MRLLSGYLPGRGNLHLWSSAAPRLSSALLMEASMNRIFALLFAVMLGCGILLAQETSPPAGSGSAQPVPPADPQSQSPAPAPATTQPATPAAPAGGQTAPSAATSNSGSKPVRIAPGSVIPARLDKTVDAKKVKQGDEVVAKVPQDLQSN